MNTTPWRGAASPRTLAGSDYAAAARTLGCDVPVIRAVWDVEAAGSHFLPDGSVVRRFEPHHFPRQHWPALGFAPRPGEAAWRASVRLSSEAMFRSAARIDMRAALRASSWGAPQIMGSNAQAAGFASAEAMVRAMAAGAPAQMDAFVRLVQSWGLDAALRGHDWSAFARRYNGSGQVEVYAARMEAAYRRHAGAASPVVLRVGDRGPAVAELQRALGVADDGAFGPETLRAVMSFQERAGLPVDGVVGYRTWTALRALHASDGAPGATVSPPAQPSTGDARTDTATQISGGTAIVSGVAVAIGQVRAALPDEMFQIALGVGALAAAGWLLGAWLRSRRRVV